MTIRAKLLWLCLPVLQFRTVSETHFEASQVDLPILHADEKEVECIAVMYVETVCGTATFVNETRAG